MSDGRCRRLSLIALLLPLCALPSTVVAQAGAARAALEEWLTQVNAESSDGLRDYVAGAFAESFLQQVPLEQAIAFHEQLRGIAPLALETVESETDTALVAVLSSSGPWLRAQLSVAGDPPRIDGLLVQPTEAPGDAAPGDEATEALEWDTLESLAARVAADGDLPGVAIAWARLGEEPSVAVAGVRAAGGDEAVEPGDRFHIGSITKSMTSTALAALVEDGELSWSATLGELLPDLPMNETYAAAELATLVRHRARIPQHLTMGDEEMTRLNGLPGTPTQQRAAYAAEVLLEEALTDGFHYSNAGYAIAGYIAERASGRSWTQLLSDEIFVPLGMETCGTGWPATPDRPGQPRGHYGQRGSRRAQGLEEYPLGAFIDPAGDVHCSAADLARYGLAHLAGLRGEDGFLDSATIEELHRVVDDGAPYAAGWGVDPESGQHRHNGSAGTFYSYLTIDPEAGIVVAFLTNAGPSDAQPAAERAAASILERRSAARAFGGRGDVASLRQRALEPLGAGRLGGRLGPTGRGTASRLSRSGVPPTETRARPPARESMPPARPRR